MTPKQSCFCSAVPNSLYSSLACNHVSAAQGLFFNSQDCCHFPFCQPNEHCVNSVSASGLNKSFYSSLTLLKWLLKLPTICSLWVFHALVSHGSCSFPFFLPCEAKARLFPSAAPLSVPYWRSFPFDHFCYSHPLSQLQSNTFGGSVFPPPPLQRSLPA